MATTTQKTGDNPLTKRAVSLLDTVGGMAAIALEGVRNTPGISKWWRDWIDQCWFLTKVTLMPVLLVAIPLGATISLQVGQLVAQLGAQSFTGTAVVVGLVREAAPLAAALLISGAGGSAMAADMGARRVRDELSAMEVMAVNPVHRLVTPRLWAASLVGVLLVSVIVLSGVAGGFFFNVIIQGVSPGAYFNGATSLLHVSDLFVSVFKAFVFGFIAATVACYNGMTCDYGPVGVGRGVNKAVVQTFIVVFAANYVITTLYFVVVPPKIWHALMATAVRQSTRSLTRSAMGVGASVAEFGSFLLFVERVLYHSLFDILIRQKYRKEVVRQISDVVVGAGAYLAGGGMLFVIAAMSLATGATVGIEGFNGLRGLGAESFTGLVASFGNTREVTPIIAAVALAAQVGAGFTAEIGAMRISDEIDALEVMGISSLVYLVCTRLIATLVALLPLYLISLFASFFASKFVTTTLLGLSPGIYDHYFHLYLPPIDIVYSVIKVIIFAIVVVLIHTYYGYNASGGPAGVGVAVGKAIRTSIITIVVLNLVLSFIFWGTASTVSLTG